MKKKLKNCMLTKTNDFAGNAIYMLYKIDYNKDQVFFLIIF